MTTNGHWRRRSGAAFVLAWASAAGAGTWSVQVAPSYVEVTGHDPVVLAVHGANAGEDVTLDTEAALGYRAAALYDRGRWAYGLDFFIHRTDEAAGPLTAGGATIFEIPHRSFAPTAGAPVYYQVLEDTTVELWVLDLYARRQLGSGDGPIALLFGLRNADFDNDYRAIAGRGDVGGTRLDAFSNYSRMPGPLVGLIATRTRGRHSLSVDLRQSVVFGDIELERTLRDFTGPPAPFAGPPEEIPNVPIQEPLSKTESITVPMTDVRLAWEMALGEHWALGASAGATAWWGLAVPPGVDPGKPDAFETTDLLTYDLAATLRFSY